MAFQADSMLILPGQQVVSELKRLIKEFPKSGLWPIVFGGDEQLEALKEFCDGPSDVNPMPEVAVEAWFRAHLHDMDPNEEEVVGEWPEDSDDSIELITHLELDCSKPLPRVHVGLFRVKTSWDVLVRLGWTPPNTREKSDFYSAVHRRWAKSYGSEIVSVTHDVLQSIVTRPPKTRADALKLACEQSAYCPDILEQFGTIATLAAQLMKSSAWYFWWD